MSKTETVNISKGTKSYNIHISSRSLFFSQPIVYKLEDGCILLRHTTIDDNIKIVTPTLDKKNNFYHFGIVIGNEEIEFKTYPFEDNSDEDCVVIYYL